MGINFEKEKGKAVMRLLVGDCFKRGAAYYMVVDTGDSRAMVNLATAEVELIPSFEMVTPVTIEARVRGNDV